MIFQCQANDLRKAVEKIKQWDTNKTELNTETLKYISDIEVCSPPPSNVVISAKDTEEITLYVYSREKGGFSIEVNGVVLDDSGIPSAIILDKFFSLCHRLTTYPVDKLEGKTLQITTTTYRITMFEVIK